MVNNRKIAIAFFASIFLCSCALNAIEIPNQSNNKNLDVSKDKGKSKNEVDNKQLFLDSINTGWGMYFENQENNQTTQEQSPEQSKQEQTKKENFKTELENGKASEKTMIMLLSEILKTNKEILKTDKEILKVLQDEYDPQPKTIIGASGQECKENESADCYVMPTFTKEAKLPVYKNFFANPSIQSAAEVVMWTDKHIFEVRKRGILQQQAMMHFGDEITPLNGLHRAGYQDVKGRYTEEAGRLKNKVILNALLKNNLEVQFYFGNNFSQNTSLITQVNNILRKFELYGRLPLSLFFKSKEAKNQVDAVLEVFNNRNIDSSLLKSLDTYISDEKQYTDRAIKSLPSLAVFDRNDNSFQIISSGSNDVDSIVRYLYRYLEMRGLVKGDETSDNDIVNENSKVYDIYVDEQYAPSIKEKETLGLGGEKK